MPVGARHFRMFFVISAQAEISKAEPFLQFSDKYSLLVSLRLNSNKGEKGEISTFCF